MHLTTTAFLTALVAAPLSSALGINCRGSSNCAFVAQDSIRVIQSYMSSIPDGTFFTNGQQIKCYGNVCAYLQNAPNAKNIHDIQLFWMTNLINHGCGACGSDPTEPGNDVSKGQLTVNWVSNPHA